jgi:hypothetical protein
MAAVETARLYLGPAPLNNEVLTFDIAEIAQPLFA